MMEQRARRFGGRERDLEVAALFDQHYKSLRGLAFLMLGDSGQAEEVVQEAFVQVHAAWARLDAPAAYARVAVINLCRSRIRRAVLERRAPVAEPRVHPGVENVAERDEVLTAVRALPERQRACIVLRYYEDLGDDQIAEILDCSVGTVKSQLHKARAHLARTLGGQHE